MKLQQVLARFLLPSPLVSLYCMVRFGCRVSPRSELELSPELSIGSGTQISSFTKIKTSGGPMQIGKGVKISSGCFLSSSAGGLHVGDQALIGPNVTIISNSYSYARLDVPIAEQPLTSKGVRIGSDVWIGAGAVVLDGADIGDHAIISAGSVVSGRIAPRSVASGIPAKVLFTRR